MLERVGRVHEVLLESSLKRRQLLHDRAEALARLARQRHSAQPKVAQRVCDQLRLDRMPPVGGAGLEAAITPIERLVLAEIRVELGHERQAAVERVAQRRAREHGVQMRDRSPDAMNRTPDLLEVAEPVEGRRGDTLGSLQRRALLREHLVDCGLDMLGPKGLELRQPAGREQRIAVRDDARCMLRGAAAVRSIVHSLTLTRRAARKLM